MGGTNSGMFGDSPCSAYYSKDYSVLKTIVRYEKLF